MAISVGRTEFNIGCHPVTGNGFSLSADELNVALTGPVLGVVFDDSGNADLQSLMAGLGETDFEQTAIRRILETSRAPEDWRVGEALAECYLCDNRGCFFPWPDGRDERKAGSSLPGADLVGFQFDGQVERFAFGEVKTSSECSYPPSAMYGRTGLKQQLEDLRDNQTIRDDLTKYLGHRAVNAPWQATFKNAMRRYLQDSCDVRIFGLLIRDVDPQQEDLRVRVAKLGASCPTNMVVELMAVYLPQGSVASFSTHVMTARAGGAA